MPSAYLRRRLRSLDEVLVARGLNRTDVGLAPVPTNENEPPSAPAFEGVSVRTLILACFACLMLGAAIGAGFTASVQTSTNATLTGR